MRVLLFAAALLSASALAQTAMACTTVEHVSANKAEHVLAPGECITSSDTRFNLKMQDDGALKLYDERHPGHFLIWTAESGPAVPGSKAVLKNDGSFMLVDPSGKELWHAPVQSAGVGDYFLVLGKARVEVFKGSTLSDPDRKMIWASAQEVTGDSDGICQCHIRNENGSPGKSLGDTVAACGVPACFALCEAKKDYFGDPLIGTYTKGTGKCKAF